MDLSRSLFVSPTAIYYNRACLTEAIADLNEANVKKVLIITDMSLQILGQACDVRKIVELNHIDTETFTILDDDIATIELCVKRVLSSKIDCIIAIGGGHCMDISKVVRALCEHPTKTITDLICSYSDISKRKLRLNLKGSVIKKLVCIPTTSGTGAESTFIAVIRSQKKILHLANYDLIPDIAVIDSAYVISMSPYLAAISAFKALVHAIDSEVSIYATEYSKSFSSFSLELIFKNVILSVQDGLIDARQSIHKAASLAGIAAANASVGLGSALSHGLSDFFHLPNGLCDALVVSQSIMYNASDPKVLRQYASISKKLGFSGNTDEEYLNSLVQEIESIKAILLLPKKISTLSDSIIEYEKRNWLMCETKCDKILNNCTTLAHYKIDRAEFESRRNEVARHIAADCAIHTNPVPITTSQIEMILEDCWNGVIKQY